MRDFWKYSRGALARVFPAAMTIAQAVAFNLFLSFFPMLLVALGVLSSSSRLALAVEEVVTQLRQVLPPGSRSAVVQHLLQSGGDPWKWVLLGLAGAMFAGLGTMACLMQGFRVVYREEEPAGFWREQIRAIGLLCLAVFPWLASVFLTVFGRQVQGWMINQFRLPALFNAAWVMLYTVLELVLAMLALSLIYHFGLVRRREWNEVWPGTVLATVLWWVVNLAFGAYVRQVPYSLVYGGLAAAIGLLVWMYLSVLVIFMGAGYNAEVLSAQWVAESTGPSTTPRQSPVGPPGQPNSPAGESHPEV